MCHKEKKILLILKVETKCSQARILRGVAKFEGERGKFALWFGKTLPVGIWG